MDGLAHQPDLAVVGGFGSSNPHDEIMRLGPGADVLVDFTTGHAAPEILLAAVGAYLLLRAPRGNSARRAALR